MDYLTDVHAYLPHYRFPNFLKVSCGCIALLLVGAGVFIFVIMPHIFAYLVTLDEYPPLVMQPQRPVALEDFTLTLTNVEQDTRCLHLPACPMAGQVDLVFTTSIDDRVYRVSLVEGTSASDPISLPLGYVLRVMAVSVSAENYLVDVQIFKLPTASSSGG